MSDIVSKLPKEIQNKICSYLSTPIADLIRKKYRYYLDDDDNLEIKEILKKTKIPFRVEIRLKNTLFNFGIYPEFLNNKKDYRECVIDYLNENQIKYKKGSHLKTLIKLIIKM